MKREAREKGSKEVEGKKENHQEGESEERHENKRN